MYLLILMLLFVNSNILIFGLPPRSTYGRDRFNSNSRCVDTETGRELYVGDSFTRSGRCISVQCLDTLELWEDRCQVPKLEGNCTRVPVANEFLDYPRCCPTYECTKYSIDDNSYTYETRIYDRYGRLLKEHITQSLKIMVEAPRPMVQNYRHIDGWKRDYSRPSNVAMNTNRRDNQYQINYN
ncbi:protein Vago [Musca vetustissima]|uniref:protein Vago n=1 Tax=Musca vetustissima TaxID=27455 RepID=UPI002AB711E2|nr:protein Vago [Musca vetustissima]